MDTTTTITKKRLLTKKEIEDTIDFVKPIPGLPDHVAVSVMENNKDRLRNQLRKQKIYPSMIPVLKAQLEKIYIRTLIQPGESVGVICAQSIGEKQTQTTLNTFHKAGQSEKSTVTGVPRFHELLSATRDPKMVSCRVYFKDGKDTIQELRETIGHSLVGLTLGDITKQFAIDVDKKDEPWYSTFALLHSDKFQQFNHCISIDLNMDKLFEYRLRIEDIAAKIQDQFYDLYCVWSPSCFGRLDIFVDVTDIELPEKRLLFINHENAPLIYMEESVQPLLHKMLICGIVGIKEIYFMKEDDEWMIETDGTNFSKLLAHEKVDSSRVISNNVWEIYETLGIEAARQFLIEEYMNIMDDINMCHTKLLVERMTYLGTICSISRYTMRKEDSGPLSKASFEETMTNFVDAAANGDIEPANGVSASVICGKRARVGTGMMELKIDISKLPLAVPILGSTVVEKMTTNLSRCKI